MVKNYRVEVQTGNRDHAGTDASVFVQLIGGKGQTLQIQLKNNLENRNKFEKGHLDTFIESAEDVGWIEKIRVNHDNSGRNAGWYLDYVRVTDMAVGLSWLAPCNRWLAKDEDDHQIDRILDIPIGNVALDPAGGIDMRYIGYIATRKENDTAADIAWNDAFTYQYQEGIQVDVTKACSVTTSAQLSVDFFAGATFAASVTASISQQLGTSSVETKTWETAFQSTLKPNSALTAVAIYYQDFAEGHATASGVSVPFEDKLNIKVDTLFLDGWLSDAQVEQHIRELMEDVLHVILPTPLPRTAGNTRLSQKPLAKVDLANIKAVLSTLPKHVIQPQHLGKIPKARVFEPIRSDYQRTSIPYRKIA